MAQKEMSEVLDSLEKSINLLSTAIVKLGEIPPSSNATQDQKDKISFRIEQYKVMIHNMKLWLHMAKTTEDLEVIDRNIDLIAVSTTFMTSDMAELKITVCTGKSLSEIIREEEIQ